MIENIILIPYRNRPKQLELFINECAPIIIENLPNSKIIIIEQEEGKDFNRGFLLNCGFKEYENKCKCFLTHDIDIFPKEKAIKEIYKREIQLNQILAISSPNSSLGGVIKVCENTIFGINGFPNNYYGWGAEDKALQNRAELRKCEIIRYNYHKKQSNNEYFTYLPDEYKDSKKINFEQKSMFEYNLFQELSREDKFTHVLTSGLNTVKYEVVERKSEKNVDIIKVKII